MNMLFLESNVLGCDVKSHRNLSYEQIQTHEHHSCLSVLYSPSSFLSCAQISIDNKYMYTNAHFSLLGLCRKNTHPLEQKVYHTRQ